MKKFGFTLLMLCVLSIFASAQTNTGGLVGTVSGPDGSIPGATITVTDNQTKLETTVVASGEGAFAIPRLPVGLYTVKVSATGFKSFVATDLKIDVGRQFTLNPTLEIGGVTESVTVIAGTDIVNATTGELSSTVSPRQVLELPLNGRNPLGLVGLQAGAAPNRGNGSEIINGGRTSSTDFTRDGINIQDVFIRNGFVPDTPTVDNTGEFTVVTLNAGADQGFGSSHVQLVTPRGGDKYHGALFLFNRNSKFAANSFFNNAAGNFGPNETAVLQGRANVGDPRQGRAFLNRNQFGGKVSGPMPLPYFGEGTPTLLKHKAFFFFSYEKFILRQQASVTRTIFLPDARNGIFSYRPTAAPAAGQCISFTNGVCKVNVLNGAGLINPIPAVSSASLGVLALDPLIQNRFLSRIPTAGNRPDLGDGLNTTGLGFNQSDPEDRKDYTGRIDVDVTSRHQLNGVYRFNQTVDARTDIDTSFNPTALAKTDAPVKFMAVAWNGRFGAALNNEVRGGFQLAPVAFINDALPQQPFLLSTLSLVTNPEVNFRDQGRDVKTYNIQDNANWVKGNHTFKFGGTWQTYKVRAFNNAGVGIPTYAIGSTGNPNTPQLGGTTTATNLFPGGIGATDRANANVLRYLLGGVAGSGTIAANVTSTTSGFVPGARLDRNLEYTNWGFYVGDQWRVGPKLTLNLGLRYEIFTPLKTTDGLYLEPVLGSDPVASVLNPNGTYDFVGKNSGKAGEFVKMDKNNFVPVLSFAYSPSFENGFMKRIVGEGGRTVIRGGFRMSYVNDEYIRSIDNAVGQNAGLTTTALARTGGVIANGTQNLNDRFSGSLSPTVAPPFVTPPITYAFNNLAAGNFGTTFAVDPNLQISREIEYNFGIQREIGYQTALEVRYVGAFSNQLVRTIDYNQIDIRGNGFGADFNRALQNNNVSGSIFGNPTCLGNGTCQALTVIPNLTTAGQTTVQSQIGLGTPADTALSLVQAGSVGTVRFLPNLSTGVGNLVVNAGKMRYNSLQAELRRRFAGGFYFQANYTFQKILTDITDDGINQSRVAPYLDNQNPHIDYNRASYDTTHFFNLNSIYELPFGKGKRFLSDGGWVNQLVGGWQLGNILQVTSGAPLSFLDARGTLNRAARANNQTAFTNLSKDAIKDLIGYRNVNGTLYFIDPAVIATSGRGANGFGTPNFSGQAFFNVLPGQTGNLERLFINGPMFWNWDASIIKRFRISESMNFQIRAEAFNVTNSTRFNAPTFNVNSTNFGKLTSAQGPRIIQLAGRFEF
jgi:hypothetical protein